jgi:hypothetical protein
MAREVFDMGPLIKAIRDLGQEVQDEVQARIEQAAQNTANAVRSAYPTGPTGNLKNMVLWGRGSPKSRGARADTGVLGAYAQAFAPHAWLYEHGYRRRKTNPVTSRPGIGWFAPREREAMLADLQSIVDRAMARSR